MKTTLTIVLNLSLFVSIAQTLTISMKRLPDTGQTGNYTTIQGEDSDYSYNTPFFQNFSNGTILDTITGLMWQKTDGGEMTYSAAINYVNNLVLDGYNDWRLPSIHESFSILNFDAINPALNPSIFPNTQAEYWWSSDSAYNDPTKIWVTNAGGGQGPHPKSETISAGGTKKFHVRAVRNASSAQTLVTQYITIKDSAIVDLATGLMWQKYPLKDTMNWEQALIYAEQLKLSGYSDWRLANIKEIASLLKVKFNNPAIQQNSFTEILSGKYWSSTSEFNKGSNAWFIDFENYGLTSQSSKTISCQVWCVRYYSNPITSVTHNESSPLNIYPMPTNGYLNIESLQSCIIRIEFYTLTGGLVKSEKLTIPQPYYTFQPGLKTGVYLITITEEKGKITNRKIIIH